GRQCGIQQRGGGGRVDRAFDPCLPAARLDQSGAPRGVELSSERVHHAAVGGWAHVSNEPAGARKRDAIVEQMSQRGLLQRGVWSVWALWASTVPLWGLAQGTPVPPPIESPVAPAPPASAPVPAVAASGVSEAASTPQPNPRRRAPSLVWQLKVEAPEPLDQLLTEYLELARFQRELANDDNLRISRNE